MKWHQGMKFKYKNLKGNWLYAIIIYNPHDEGYGTINMQGNVLIPTTWRSLRIMMQELYADAEAI